MPLKLDQNGYSENNMYIVYQKTTVYLKVIRHTLNALSCQSQSTV